MRVLVACEFSGIVRDAFRARGHDAISCDLLPSERPGPHIQGDVLPHLGDGWDLMIAHPPCTDLALSGARWWPAKKADGRQQAAVEFFRRLTEAPIPRKAVENPIGIMSRLYRRPDQIVQPYWFGDSVQKATCLWLWGLPRLTPTKVVDRGPICTAPNGKKHGGAHTMRGLVTTPVAWHNRHPKDRGLWRSRTFPGLATAMAEQW